MNKRLTKKQKKLLKNNRLTKKQKVIKNNRFTKKNGKQTKNGKQNKKNTRQSKKAGLYAGPSQFTCCPPDKSFKFNKNDTKNLPIKFVRVHGSCSANTINTFKVPKDTYIITMVKPGDYLGISDSIKDDIFNIYKTPFPSRKPGENYSLFKNDDKSIEITRMGKNIMDKNHKMGSTDLFFKNHPPGTIMNNTFISFQDPQCIEDNNSPSSSCNIFCLNKKNYKTKICNPRYMSYKSGKVEDYEGYLEDLTHIEGPGIYILNTCRGVGSRGNSNLLKAMRVISR